MLWGKRRVPIIYFNFLMNYSDFYAALLPKPTVTYSKNFAASNQEMICSFDFPEWKNVSYKVEWFARSITPIKTDTWCVSGQPGNGQNDCKRRSSSIFSPGDFELGDTVSNAMLVTTDTDPFISCPLVYFSLLNDDKFRGQSRKIRRHDDDDDDDDS